MKPVEQRSADPGTRFYFCGAHHVKQYVGEVVNISKGGLSFKCI